MVSFCRLLLFCLLIGIIFSCKKDDDSVETPKMLVRGTWNLKSQRLEVYNQAGQKVHEEGQLVEFTQVSLDDRLLSYFRSANRPYRVDTYNLNAGYSPNGYQILISAYPVGTQSIQYRLPVLDPEVMTWEFDQGPATYLEGGVAITGPTSKKIYEFERD